MQHPRALLVGRIDEVKLHHELAAVAYAERERVLAGIEAVERLLCLGVVEECARPALGRAEHVGVGEASAEDNHVHLVQSLAAGDEVGHCHVLDIEAGEIERIRHLALAVGAFLAYYGSTHARRLTAVGVDAERGERAGKLGMEAKFERLGLVVLKTLLGAAVEALLRVEQVRGFVPHVAQVVNAKLIGSAVLLAKNMALLRGLAKLHVRHARLVKHFLESPLVLVGHLHHHAGILCEESRDEVGVLEVVKRHLHAALRVGEAHLQKTGDKAAGRDVVPGKEKPLAHELLHGVERRAEIFSVSHCRHVTSHVAEALRESRSAEAQTVKGEVDMVESAFLLVCHDGRNHAAHVAYLAARADNHRTRRDDLLPAGILLRKRKRVLACRHVYLQSAAEVAQSLHALVEACVLALLRAAGPHPVCRKRHTVKPLGKRRPDNVGQSLGHGEHRTGSGVSKTGLRRVPDGRSDALAAAVVKRHDTAVGERQLQLALCLLVRHLARHGAVDLIGEPVLAGHGLQLQHAGEILVHAGSVVSHVGVLALHSFVGHHRLGRVAEHLRHVKVKGTLSVCLLESKMRVARSLSHHVHRRALALSDAAHVVKMFFLYEQAHALLALVGYNLFCRKRAVANGQLVHMYQPAALFDELGKAVDVSGRPVVVYAHYGVDLLLAEGADEVVGALLHLGVGTLHGVEFYARGVTPRVYGAYRAAAQADAVVVAAHDDDLVAFLRRAFQAVALRAVAHAAGKHYHFVVAVLLAVFLMLEGEHGAGDERLTKLVAEVGRAVRRLHEYLLRCLVEPFAHGKHVFPVAPAVQTRVRRHIHRRAGNGPGTDTAAHTVAYLSARAGRGSVERLYGRGKIVCLRLDGDYALDVLHGKPVARGMVLRRKLLHHRTLGKGHIVLVCRYDVVRILFRRLLDKGEERGRHFLSVNDKRAAEYLVAAVLRVYLSEAEDLAVGELAPELVLHAVQIVDLGGREGKPLLLVIAVEVVNVHDGRGLYVHGEYALVEPVVHALQHRVMLGVGVLYGEILLYTRNAAKPHVLGNLHGIRAPRRDHLAARPDVPAFQPVALQRLSLAVEPAKLFHLLRREGAAGLCGYHALLRGTEKQDHIGKNV